MSVKKKLRNVFKRILGSPTKINIKKNRGLKNMHENISRKYLNEKEKKEEKKKQKFRHRSRECDNCGHSFRFDVVRCPLCSQELNN